MKIRTHLVLMPAVALVPLLLFSGLALDNLLDAEREAALRGVQEAARATSLAVDREWAYAEGMGRALGTSVLLAQGDYLGFFTQAKNAVAGRDLNVALVDGAGSQILNTAVPFGVPIATAAPAAAAEVAQIFAEGRPRVSDVVRGPATGRLVVVMRVPVATAAGRSYLVAPWMYAESLARAFAAAGGAGSGSGDALVGIFDRQGRTIAINRGPSTLLGDVPRADLLQAILQGQTTVLRNQSRGGERLYTMLSRSTVTGWTVAVGVPERQVEAAARQAVWLTAAGLTLAFALAVLAAFLYGQRLLRSMAAAARSAAMLGRGHIPPATKTGVDEVDQVQNALRESGELLARTEVERSQLLVQAEAARTEAERQNRAKDDFLAMLGHELRNPLSAITGGLAVMEHPAASADAQQRARQIVGRQAGRLTSIVDELLDASRVLTGKVALSRQRVDLAEVARSSVEAAQISGSADRHRLRLQAQPAWVDGDPVRLAQIATNLIENALKYTPDGGEVQVTVDVAGADAVLAVRDTGVGIGPELLSRVFDVFVQGPASLDRSKGGLGIGLAVVRAMVHQQGGRVEAASDGEGRGSCFTVRLPLLAGGKDAADAAAGPAAAAGSVAGLRILVVDDNEDARATLAGLLTLEGAQVFEAADGASALRCADSERPAVAVVDIGLPDISGYEVARRLRQDPRTAAMRLVALTGYGQEEDQQRARHAGFDHHLTKPVEAAQLLALLAAPAARHPG